MRAATIGLVWLMAAVTIGSFLALYLIAMLALGGPVIPALAVVGLAAMSIPLGVGGWGVREVSVSILAGSLASSVEWAVTTSAGYGLLAAISTLPGAITLMLRLWRRHQESDQHSPSTRRSRLAEQVFGAHVLTEPVAAERATQRFSHDLSALEADAWDPIADEYGRRGEEQSVEHAG